MTSKIDVQKLYIGPCDKKTGSVFLVHRLKLVNDGETESSSSNPYGSKTKFFVYRKSYNGFN